MKQLIQSGQSGSTVFLMPLAVSTTLHPNKKWPQKQIATIHLKPTSFVWNFRHNRKSNKEKYQFRNKHATIWILL